MHGSGPEERWRGASAPLAAGGTPTGSHGAQGLRALAARAAWLSGAEDCSPENNTFCQIDARKSTCTNNASNCRVPLVSCPQLCNMSTSRRRTNRRVVDEEIEDAQPSQDASQSQRRGSNRQAPRRARSQPESDDGLEVEDDEAPIDVDNLADAPITDSAALTIKGCAQDWGRIQERIMQSARTITEVGEATADAA